MRTVLRRYVLICIVGMTAIGSIASSVAFAKDEYRTWGDAKGKNKIKAKFVKLEDDVVTLEKEDGDEVEIELKKLSPADQKFVAEAAKDSEDNPFKSKSDDPFKAKPKGEKKPGKTKDKESDADEVSDGPRTVKVDLSSVEQISLSSPSENWQVDIPAGEASTTKGKSKPITLPAKTNFFEGIKGMAFNRGSTSKTAVVGFLLDKHVPKPVTRVVLCDLATGKCSAPASANAAMIPIALHDDGKQIVMRREEFGFGNQDRLEIWIPKGKQVTKSISWIPYEAASGGDRDVLWAEFVNPETLATSSRGGKVVLWKFPEIEPICQFETVQGAVPALSPNRNLIAYSNGSDVGLFDVEKREVIAQKPTPEKLQWPYMAFSPSGNRVAAIAFDKVLIWDIENGALERNIACTGLPIHGSIDYPNDEFILAGNAFLIDLENQVKLWTYEGFEQVRSSGGMTYFAVTNGEKNPGALVAISIPHPPAKDLLNKAITDPNLFVIKKGTAVRIDANGITDASQRERVSNGLRKQLDAIGCKGGTTGTIDIVATVEGPTERVIRFRHTGDYKFKEFITRVKFVSQNQTVWETSQSNVPFFVQLKGGENMETHLRGLEKPSYEFFERVQLPKLLQKPTSGQPAANSLTLGKSQVTVGGIR